MTIRRVCDHLITGAALALAGVLIWGGVTGRFDAPRAPAPPAAATRVIEEVPLTDTLTGGPDPAALVPASTLRPSGSRRRVSAVMAIAKGTNGDAAGPDDTVGLPEQGSAPNTFVRVETSPNPRAGAAEQILRKSPRNTVDDALKYALRGIEPYPGAPRLTLREDTWSGELSVGENEVIAHQLFKGNRYMFAVGAAAPGARVSFAIYNEAGQSTGRISPQTFIGGGSYLIGNVEPERTGMYYLILRAEHSPEERTSYGVIYGYR